MQKVTEREVTIMLRHDLRNAARTVEHGRGLNRVYRRPYYKFAAGFCARAQTLSGSGEWFDGVSASPC